MPRDYSKLTERETLEILQKEWPEFIRQSEQNKQDGYSLVEWLSILESFG
jgi:hypothetical protein